MEQKQEKNQKSRKLNVEKLLKNFELLNKVTYYRCNPDLKVCMEKKLDRYTHIADDLGFYPKQFHTPQGFWVREEKKPNEFPDLWYFDNKICAQDCKNPEYRDQVKASQKYFQSSLPSQTVVPFLTPQEMTTFSQTTRQAHERFKKLPPIKLQGGKKCLQTFFQSRPPLSELKYCFEMNQCSIWLQQYIETIVDHTPNTRIYLYLIPKLMTSIEILLGQATKRWLIFRSKYYDYAAQYRVKEEKKEEGKWIQNDTYLSLQQVCPDFCSWFQNQENDIAIVFSWYKTHWNISERAHPMKQSNPPPFLLISFTTPQGKVNQKFSLISLNEKLLPEIHPKDQMVVLFLRYRVIFKKPQEEEKGKKRQVRQVIEID